MKKPQRHGLGGVPEEMGANAFGKKNRRKLDLKKGEELAQRAVQWVLEQG